MKIAIIGAGAMGEALLAGWLAAGQDAATICFVEPVDERAAHIRDTWGITRVQLADAATAATIVLAVKPQYVAEALRAIRPTRDSLVVSIAAGVPLATIEVAAPGVPTVRVMPNTPALVGKGMAAVAPGTHATPDHTARVVELMQAVGKAIVVPEYQLDAVTAVSGSGPAYLFYLAEAMIEAGVHLGLARADATTLVHQTLLGSATMLDEVGETATVLREKVTSPAGTTAAALGVMDDRGVRAAMIAALRAARDRGLEMASADSRR